MIDNHDIAEQLHKKLLALQPISPELQAKLDKKFRLEFNYNSNHLEGNTLTYGETELLLIFGDTMGNHNIREYEEMKAHDAAWHLIEDWAKDKERPLTEQHIKNLNEIILVQPYWKEAITTDGQPTRRQIKVGNYKEFPNSVRLQNGEIFSYASPADTPIQMQELIDWYRREEGGLPPITLAALLHYKFVRIHPFDDGNGRISRLLMNYVLLRNGYPPVIIKSEDKANYLRALHMADTGDYEPFISYIADQVVWSLNIAIRAANGESIDEPGDLDKEIAVWKTQIINSRPETVPKTNKLVFERYADSIKPLFQLFIEKHHQFDELFDSNNVVAFPNNVKGDMGFEYLDEAIKRAMILQEKIDNDHEDVIDEEIHLEEFSIHYNYNYFKKAGINAFNQVAFLRCQFTQFEWELTGNGIQLNKGYKQPLTSNEITDFINICLKTTFTEIQAKMNLSNL